MQEQSITPIRIQTLLFILRKHKWKILTILISTVITVAIGCLMAMPVYQASAKLLLKAGRENVYVSPAGDLPAITDNSWQAEKVKAELEILKSVTLVKELVDRVGVNRLYSYPDRTLKGKLFKRKSKLEHPPLQKVYEIVLESLDASSEPNSNVIKVTYEWPDPVIAVSVVNTLLELYMDHHLRVHANPGTYDLIEEQTKKWERKLRKSEEELETFKRSESITSLSEQRTILLSRISEAESQKNQTESEIQGTVEMIAALEAQSSKLGQNVQLQEMLNQDSSTLAVLKSRLVELKLQGLKDDVQKVEEMIAQEEKKKKIVSGKTSVSQDMESDLLKTKARLASLNAEQKSQKAEIASYQKRLQKLDGLGKELKGLERQVALAETNYDRYLNKFEEAKISESMDKQKIANVSVVQPAVATSEPVKPKKRLTVMLGGFLALFAGIGIAFLIEFINPVFYTREDVEQFLGLPVIAILPEEERHEIKDENLKTDKDETYQISSKYSAALIKAARN